MEKARQRAHSSRRRLLEGIDRGGYAEAIAIADTEPELLENPDDALLRAELALYRDEFADAEAVLDRLGGADLWIDETGEAGNRARRTRLLRVEVACFSGDLDDAERLVRPMVDAAIRGQDVQSELRAIYDLARITRHRAQWTLTIDRLEHALDLAREAGNTFYEGRIAYTLGYCWYNLNRVDLAVPYLQSALDLLTSTENLRFRATVEIFYGCLLSDRGEPEAALEMLARAESTVGNLGVMSDMITARMNVARTLLVLGKYEEVERSLTELLGWERGLGGTPIELMTLRLLAIAQCVRGRTAEAQRSAEEALRLADIRGNEADRLEARMLVARAKSLQGEIDAVAQLDALVSEVDAGGTPYLQAEARIYLAGAVKDSDPARARALCVAARQMPVLAEYIWLQREVEFVEYDLNFVPVRVTEDGQLIMDSRLGWPDLKAAREATERYWLERALAETGDNVSAASRLLGLTRNEGQYLHKLVVKGEPARPSRSKTQNAPGKGPRRRPRTRS